MADDHPISTHGLFKDLTGQKFSFWTVIAYRGRTIGTSLWLCRCDCGNEKIVSGHNLRDRTSKSCGCFRLKLRREPRTQQGHVKRGAHHPLYAMWRGIKARCYREWGQGYAWYGAEGVTVDDRWLSGDGTRGGFACFIDDMGERPSPKHSVGRIKNDQPYGPSNCRWETPAEQGKNKRNNRIVVIGGHSMILADAIRLTKISETTVYRRLKQGFSLQGVFDHEIAKRKLDV